MGIFDFLSGRRKDNKPQPLSARESASQATPDPTASGRIDLSKITPEQAAALYRQAGVTRARPQHYKFAHRVLPSIADGDPGGLMTLLNSPDGEGFLKEMWDSLAESLEIPEEERIPNIHLGILGCGGYEGYYVALIRLPPPIRMTECHMVGLVWGPLPQDDRDGIDPEEAKHIPIRTYTLEYSLDHPPVLGSWIQGERANYGVGPDPHDPHAFMARIVELARSPA